MSLIDITDPKDSSVRGGLSNPDPIDWKQVIGGSAVNLTIDEFTSSGDVKELFNLNEPPSFSGPFLVWGELDADSDALSLFLATSTGDRTFPFCHAGQLSERHRRIRWHPRWLWHALERQQVAAVDHLDAQSVGGFLLSPFFFLLFSFFFLLSFYLLPFAFLPCLPIAALPTQPAASASRRTRHACARWRRSWAGIT